MHHQGGIRSTPTVDRRMRVSGSGLRRIADIACRSWSALFLVSLVDSSASDDPPGLVALGVVAAIVQGAALWWRRSYPLAVFGASRSPAASSST